MNLNNYQKKIKENYHSRGFVFDGMGIKIFNKRTLDEITILMTIGEYEDRIIVDTFQPRENSKLIKQINMYDLTSCEVRDIEKVMTIKKPDYIDRSLI